MQNTWRETISRCSVLFTKVAKRSKLRGSKPGERRGGRKKGVKNRQTKEIEQVLAGLKCDPIRGMALIAKDTSAPLELRGRMFSELAQYIHPKRKAIEHSGTGAGGTALTLTVRSVLQPVQEVKA